jgi:hypothetical protein
MIQMFAFNALGQRRFNEINPQAVHVSHLFFQTMPLGTQFWRARRHIFCVFSDLCEAPPIDISLDIKQDIIIYTLSWTERFEIPSLP